MFNLNKKTEHKCLSWKDAEWQAKEYLKKMFPHLQFSERQKLKIGNIKREFDLVSSDKKVIAQVKVCQKRDMHLSNAQRDTRFKRNYMFDCLLLDKAKAHRKFFFLASDKELFLRFKDWSRGLLSSKVELKFINAWE